MTYRIENFEDPIPLELFYDIGSNWDDDYPIEDEDGELAYARMLERRSETGSWFGYGE